MTEPKYKRVAEDVKELYWDHTTAEIQEKLDIGGSTYSRAKEYAGLPRKTKAHKVAYEHDISLDRLLYHFHHDAKMSVNEMSDALGISRSAIYTGFKHTDVDVRGQSDAERVKNQQMSEEERKQQTRAARERHREKYGDGGYIAKWVDENPKEHAQNSQKYGQLGAPAREENGMAGVTGQDHPKWRGGKHLIDALRKQLRPSWWTVRDEERVDECQMCGASDCKLDVHHIVPLSAGGTNESWNLMTLCESCHRTAEAYTRQFDAFRPVLTK